MRNKVRFNSGKIDVQLKEGGTVYTENGNVLNRTNYIKSTWDYLRSNENYQISIMKST